MSLPFNSRRSTVHSTKGIVASTQPAATAAGIKVLELGGNCVEAAVAVSACLCVLEPGSTGIGGDCFALYYEKSKGKVHGINGSGRSGKDVSVQIVKDHLNDQDAKRIPWNSIHAVTVPGAIAGWLDSIEHWGSKKVTLRQILEPAITLARDGFVLHDISAKIWQSCEKKIRDQNPDLPFTENPFLDKNGNAPKEGDLVFNKPVARALEIISEQGKQGFYVGQIAEALIKTTTARGHKLTFHDLESHTSTIEGPETSNLGGPISVTFQDHKIWEIAPNGQGLVALLALGMLEELQASQKVDIYNLKPNSVEYLHLIIELCKLGFYDSDEYVSDLEFNTEAPIKELLGLEYLKSRADLFKSDSILDSSVITHGVPNRKNKSDTVYLTVSDANGDACSFINSVYEGFGSAIVVPEFGFCLHNRGANFNLTEGTNNCIEGGKRPYHTIIPSMITRNDGENSLYASFGNMGGYMQPVGHVQHVINMLVFGMSPQQLIDQPRICLTPDPKGLDRGKGADGPVSTAVTVVCIEEGIDQDVVEGLEKLGHAVKVVRDYKRGLFGRAQIIKDVSKNGQLIYAAGSDPRGDGSAAPLL